MISNIFAVKNVHRKYTNLFATNKGNTQIHSILIGICTTRLQILRVKSIKDMATFLVPTFLLMPN